MVTKFLRRATKSGHRAPTQPRRKHTPPRRNRSHTFKQALATAMKQAYGITIRAPSSTRHGTYAEAIERARAQAA
jgi:hypothetical protein